MKVKDVEIIDMIGTIATRTGYDGREQSLDLNLIRHRGQPFYDLRWWCEGEPLHGVSLTERTLAELGELIDVAFERKKNEK